jgi:hypothetical protein
MGSVFTSPPVIDWEVEIAADEAALKIKLNALRTDGRGAQKIVFHPGTGFAITYLRPTYNFQGTAVLQTNITDPTFSV